MFKIKLKTALLVLHFCISISFSSDDKGVINDSLTTLIENWMNNLSQYQYFDTLKTEEYNDHKEERKKDEYYKEYLGKIFYDNANILLLIGNNDPNNNTENNNEENNKKEQGATKNDHGSHMNTGYAIVTLSFRDDKTEHKYVIDINKNIIGKNDVFKQLKNNYDNENKLYFNKIQNDIYKKVRKLPKETNNSIQFTYKTVLDSINNLKTHDEYKILDKLLKLLLDKNLKNVTNIKIDLFTYHDMCPSCWMVWNKCFDDFKNILGIDDNNNVNINVFSMKPYNFTDHSFLSLLKDKYQFELTKKGSLHSITNIDKFNNTNIGIRRSNVKNSNNINFFDNKNSSTEDKNFINHIKQIIDEPGIKLLQQYYKLLQEHDANLLQHIKFVKFLYQLWKELSWFAYNFVIPFVDNLQKLGKCKTIENVGKNISNIKTLIKSNLHGYTQISNNDTETIVNCFSSILKIINSSLTNKETQISTCVDMTHKVIEFCNIKSVIDSICESTLTKIYELMNNCGQQYSTEIDWISFYTLIEYNLFEYIQQHSLYDINVEEIKKQLNNIEELFDKIVQNYYIKIAEYVIKKAKRDSNNNINNINNEK